MNKLMYRQKPYFNKILRLAKQNDLPLEAMLCIIESTNEIKARKRWKPFKYDYDDVLGTEWWHPEAPRYFVSIVDKKGRKVGTKMMTKDQYDSKPSYK